MIITYIVSYEIIKREYNTDWCMVRQPAIAPHCCCALLLNPCPTSILQYIYALRVVISIIEHPLMSDLKATLTRQNVMTHPGNGPANIKTGDRRKLCRISWRNQTRLEGFDVIEIASCKENQEWQTIHNRYHRNYVCVQATRNTETCLVLYTGSYL